MKKLALLGLALLVACTEPKALDFEEHYEGQDVRADFLKQYSGTFRLPNPESGTVQGLDQGNTKLTINSDGTYVLVGEKMRVSKNGDKRTAICTVEERGTVSHVQKFAKTKNHIQVGRTRVGNFDPVGGLLVLEPQDSKFAHAETVVTDERGDLNVDKEDPFSEKDFKWLCARTDDRVFYIENFLRDGLLLARKTESRNPKFYLDERIVTREGVEWLWLDGEIARKAVAETTAYTLRGVSGIQVLKESVRGVNENSDNLSFGWDSTSFSGDRVHFNLVGRTAKGNRPMWILSGTLIGVSYSPNATAIVAHLNHAIGSEPMMILDSVELPAYETKKIEEVLGSVKPLSEKLNALDKTKNVVTVALPTKSSEAVRVDTKVKQVLVAKEGQP